MTPLVVHWSRRLTSRWPTIPPALEAQDLSTTYFSFLYLQLLLPVLAVLTAQVDVLLRLGDGALILLGVLVLPVLAVLADHGGEELEEDRLVAEDEEFQSRIFHYINFCLLFFNLKCTTSYFSLGYLKRKFK